MRGISEQEGPPLTKAMRDAVMNAVGRKPIDAFYVNLEILNGPGAHIIELKVLMIFCGSVADRPDQSRAARVLQGKHGQEIPC